MRLLTLFLLMLLLATSCTTCTNNDASSDIDADGTSDQFEDADNMTLTYYERGTPSEYIKGIPVYDSFNDIEYMLHEETDTTYLINFWATWCKPCVKEMPYIEAINKAYVDEKVKVILVSLDFKKLVHQKLAPFIEENNIESEVIYLADGSTSKWGDRISTFWDGSIPFSVIYNQYDRKEFAQVHSFEEINNIVSPMVEEVKLNAIPASYDEDIMANKGEEELDYIPIPIIEDEEVDGEPLPMEPIETDAMEDQ